MLEFASDNLKDNKKIVLEGVKQVGWVACYASERLLDDKEIILEGVKVSRPDFIFCQSKTKRWQRSGTRSSEK